MSDFPRIDPSHPLTEAARYVNAQSEEIGLERTIEWLGMNVSPGELAYLAEQRAYRAVAAAMLGVNLLPGPEAEQFVRAVQRTSLWKDFSTLLISCYMDGMVIGWKAADLARPSSS